MLAVILSARALSPAEFGRLVLFQSATLMAASLVSFSTQQPLVKLGAIALAGADWARVGRLIGLGLLLDALAGTAGCIAAFSVIGLAGRWIGIGPADFPVAAAFAGSLLFTGYWTANGIFRLLDRFGILSLLQAGCAAAVLAATFCLWRAGAGLAAYCWAWAIFYALNSQLPLAVAIMLARKAGISIRLPSPATDRDEIRAFMAYCWTTWGMASVEAVRTNGDSLLVGAAVSVEAAGVYNVARQIAGVVRKFSAVYASAAFPEISAMSAHGEEENAARVKKRMLWLTGAAGAIAVAAAAIFGAALLRLLFTPHFQGAWMPLVILTGAAAAQLISHTLSMYVQVYIGPEKLFRLYALALIPFVIAVLPLTFALSISGTALAQLLFPIALIMLCDRALRTRHAA